MEAWTHPLFLDDKERLFELLTAETLSTLHGDDYDARELYPPGHPHAGEPSLLLREGRSRLRTVYEPSTNLLGEPLLLRGGTLAQAATVRPDNLEGS